MGARAGRTSCDLCLTSDIMDNGHMGTPSWGQTDMTANITFPQRRWEAVIMLHCIETMT